VEKRPGLALLGGDVVVVVVVVFDVAGAFGYEVVVVVGNTVVALGWAEEEGPAIGL